jgi:protein tyrosine phosphatase (PTP) superfamily phosphohydrolase (DUF442 family)
MGERIEDIYNFRQLTDRIATAGQPTMSQYPAIATAGYQTVINLAVAESTNALPDEGAIAAKFGLEFRWHGKHRRWKIFRNLRT